MPKNSLKIAMIILFQLTLISCKDTLQKANDFVNSYNSSAMNFTNNTITSTSAKLVEGTNVEIRFETNIPYDSEDQTYSKIFPNLIANVFTKDNSIKDLIEEGVVFSVSFYADNGRKIDTFDVDKKKLDEMQKNAPTNKEISGMGGDLNLPSDLKEALAVMNKSLPIENNDGTKIIKIDISQARELVYTVEVPDEFSESLKGEDAKKIMKEEILRSTDLNRIMSGLTMYGITKIKYLYQDSKAKKVNEIIMTSADLN